MMIIKIEYYFQEKEKPLKIEELNKKIDYDNLKYTVISSSEVFEFDKSEDPILLLNDIKKVKISLEEAKNQQQDYDKYLNEITKRK